jgi:hypothetical protein
LRPGVPPEDWTCKACKPVQTAALKTDATASLRQSPDFYNVFEFFQRFGELKGLEIEPVSMLVRTREARREYSTILPILASVTAACVKRTGAATSVERRRRELASAISPE